MFMSNADATLTVETFDKKSLLFFFPIAKTWYNLYFFTLSVKEKIDFEIQFS